MCLSNIDKKCEKKEGVGYKVFYLKGKHLYSPITDYRVKNGWNIDKKKGYLIKWNTIKKGEPLHYLTGFHIFLNLDAAELYKETLEDINFESLIEEGYKLVVKMVEYKEAYTSGYTLVRSRDLVDHNLKTVVARKFRIIKEV